MLSRFVVIYVPVLLLHCTLQDFRRCSETSVITTLTSDEELQESTCVEFLREVRAISTDFDCPINLLTLSSSWLSTDVAPDDICGPADPVEPVAGSILGPGTASHGQTSSIG